MLLKKQKKAKDTLISAGTDVDTANMNDINNFATISIIYFKAKSTYIEKLNKVSDAKAAICTIRDSRV